MAINRTRTANHFRDHLSVFEPGYPIQKGYIGRLLYNDDHTISDVVAEIQAIVQAAEPDMNLHEGHLHSQVCAFNKLMKHKQLNLTAEWPSLIELFLQPFPIVFTSFPGRIAPAIETAEGGASSYSCQRSELRKLYPKEEQWLMDNYETAEGVCLLPSTLYYNYLRHCEEQGLKPMTSILFDKLLRSVFPGLCRQRLSIRGNFRYHLSGLRVKASSSLNQLTDEQTMAPPQQQIQVKDNWTSDDGWQQTRTEEIDTLEDVSFASDVHEIQIYVYSSRAGHNAHTPVDVEESAATTMGNSNSSVHVRDILSDITSEYQTVNTKNVNEGVRYTQDVESGEDVKKRQSNQHKFDFRYADNLYLKIRTRIHVEEKLSKCVVCGLAFTQIESLSEHLKTHVEKLYRCDDCGLTFTEIWCLSEHLQIHKIRTRFQVKDKLYKCVVCGLTFTQIESFSEHLKTHVEEAFRCDDCGLTFAHIWSLSEHLQTHIGKLFRCKVCGLEFLRLADRMKHTKIHLKERRYMCDICGYRSKTLSYLQAHVMIHTGEKPYQCEVCDTRFLNSYNLMAHTRIHTGERPYKCNVCGFAFTQIGSLNTHKLIHTGEKPYMCDICGFKVNRKDNLRLHKKIHK